MKIALIGTGRVGTALGRALAGSGLQVASLYDEKLSASRRARTIIGRGRIARDGGGAARAADIVFLCVPDGELAAAALELALTGIDWRKKIVLHTSGSLTSAVLAPLRCEGAATGSFHPAQSFPRPETPAAAFAGTTIAIEGDARAAAAARRLALALGAKPLRIKASEKLRYHAACCFASNLFIPLFDLACGLLEDAGITPRRAEALLLPLVEGTLRNIAALGRVRALTGPISRGDAATAGLHLDTLPRRGSHRRVYQVLGGRALELAVRNGLDKKPAAAVRRTLERK
ncbi:MAG: DUF2520 domain-containing protein [Acidobacteriota bacterium]|nr:DUF2520 domain-containing protein [Acidobacteriota bacterium]